MNSGNRKLLTVAWIQAFYYTSTGVWPLVELRSFLAVTGPKTDIWLVRTVGALLAVTGLVLARAAKRKQFPAELVAIAIGQAAVLAAVDFVYAGAGRISPVYLFDGVAEIALIATWLAFGREQLGPQTRA
ncbi:hypothetical protein DB347_24955 [Opitutaceae bacterium EW11]|nr:hypothetical protein DB347_24955 [Opitutaceae bacterium EW11]